MGGRQDVAIGLHYNASPWFRTVSLWQWDSERPDDPAGHRDSDAVAAAKVLKSGLNSTLLLNFKDHMSEPNAQAPVLL